MQHPSQLRNRGRHPCAAPMRPCTKPNVAPDDAETSRLHQDKGAETQSPPHRVDGGLSGKALVRNQNLLAHVRRILARGDLEPFAALMGQFGELVEDCGPLGHLRFASEAFATHTTAALADVASEVVDGDPELLCERVYAAVAPHLCTFAFVAHLRAELQIFVAQTYVPRADRLAACAALLTLGEHPEAHALAMGDLPALYAIYRTQLACWLQRAGTRQTDLLHMAWSSRATR